MSVTRTQFDTLRFSGLETKRLAWAFAVSLTAHVLVWSGYELGRELNFWQQLHWPAWLRIVQKLEPVPLLLTQNVEPPLVFVAVNPEQAATEAPQNAKYFSDKNSRAANPDAERDIGAPKLNGKQTDVPQAEDVSRPQFAKLQPTPPAQPAERQPQPAQQELARNAGDLTLGKPLDTHQSEPQPQPRPRTVHEALARQGSRPPSVPMRQEGGVRRQALVPAFDVKLTGFGEYDARFYEAVCQRWFDLLDSRKFALDRTGKVALRFHLNYDGSISDMKFTGNTAGDLLGYVCQKAVLDTEPFERFPSDMRLKLGDYADVQFTFYYY
jgi:hypothetical protein